MKSPAIKKIFGVFAVLIAAGILTLQAQPDSTNIPLVIIDTQGREIQDEPKIPAVMKIIYHPGGYNRPEEAGNVYDGMAGIEIRGRYSASLPQKPYGFETRNPDGSNLNVPLLGMPPENDWILLANYNDKVFMRNTLAFHLFRQMGHYAPRTQFCEVIINGRYDGIYVFTEKIKRDKGRVNVSRLTANDNTGDELTGGYIIKIDYYDETDSWTSNYPPPGFPDKKVRFVYHYPEPDKITPSQKAYIRNFIFELESVVYTPGNSLDKISKYIDINSFVDYFILSELARNVDTYKKSSYFYKDKDSKDRRLHAGPVWDFDWAWKNINECFFGALDGSGWAYKVFDCNPWPKPPGWTLTLMKNHEFRARVVSRYQELRETILSEESIFGYIDSVNAVLDEAQQRHYARWQILGINVGAPETDEQPLTYDGEIVKFKNWIATRLDWLDRNIPPLLVTAVGEEAVPSSGRLYPNPAKAELVWESDKSVKSLRITTLHGTPVPARISHENNRIFIDISGIAPGVYLAFITLSDGSAEMKKFIRVP